MARAASRCGGFETIGVIVRKFMLYPQSWELIVADLACATAE
jgi:hypothetical protein